MYVETRGSGPPLVLVHGWAMHGGIFGPLVDALARVRTLHLVDLPGHGRSAERDVRLDLAGCAARLVAQVGAADWLGWSLGGLVALEAARAAPERVRSIALLATNPRFVTAPDWQFGVAHEVFVQFGADLARDYRGTLDRFVALECHGSDCAREELRTLRAQLFERGEPAVRVLEDGLHVLDESDLRSVLPSLAMPALWIAGARDRLVPWQSMEWAAGRMPHARFAKIAGGGHAPFIGHPDRVLDVLLPFLAGGDGEALAS
ncbi:MAG TPA: pimeloyl-ACP methyl ester esterase BioH [Xanthomonadales bacterium]|nr:pimeloyl-ACP methyl ester esterase BioH [Xanthomonadales bacterium]